ncbi:hypothetical protein BT96DRAFT_990510 [Gymnopus androsaceus JB14]|uniref:Uncharacterized protein n=1 Tax=Gymnopus androsaceus JB14 TaxID=1447944 RepID=A0A6A4HZ16_9AGAR|nr:hypothetical protein BT96DRAFT_990510 [Gymnopus androsaceus JB14]
MVDTSCVYCKELDHNANLNKVLTPTAAAIALCTPQPASKPNYQPPRGTGLFARSGENSAAITLASKACTTGSAAVCAVLTNITNSLSPSDGSPNRLSSAAADDADDSSPVAISTNATSNASAGAASANSVLSTPDHGPSNASAAAAMANDVPAGSTEALLDTSNTSAGTGTANSASSTPDHGPSNASAAAAMTNDTPTASADALSDASAGPAVDASAGLTCSAGTSMSTNGASGAEVAGECSLPGDADAADGSGNDPEPRKKKKRSEMGTEEHRLRRQAAQDCLEKLAANINKLFEEQEELFAKYAKLNNVSVDHIKKLSHQLPSMKSQKKASDYNVLVYFKGKELNATQAKGSRVPLKDHHPHVKRNDDLQDILHDADTMKALHLKYNEEKAEEKIAAVCVSKRAHAKSVAEKMNLFQQEIWLFCHGLSSDANLFGMVVRGSFKSTIVPGFYGHGPADVFFWTHFCMGVQDILNLYESFVVTAEKVGTRKLYQREMSKEIMGMVNLNMSYVSFAKNIAVPYKVNIKGWPEDIPHSYPQLAADQTKRLYNAWNSGGAHWYCMTSAEAKSYEKEAEKNGELEPRVRNKCSDAGSKHAWGGDDRSDNSREDEDGSDGGDDVQPQKKSGGGGKRARGRGRGGLAKKSVSRDGGAKKSTGSGGKKPACTTQKKSAVGVSRKAAEGGKKSLEPVGKGKKPTGKKRKTSQCFVVSNSDSGSGEGYDEDDDDAEFMD